MTSIQGIFISTKGSLWNNTDDMEFRIKLIQTLFRDNGIDFTNDGFLLTFQQLLKSYPKNIFETMIWNYVKPDTALFAKLNQSFIKIYKNLNWDEFRSFFTLNQHALGVIHKLSRSYRLVTIDEDPIRTTKLMEEVGIVSQFFLQTFVNNIPYVKPDVRFFLFLLEKAGLAPEKVVVVSNRLNLDIIPALNLGMKTIKMKKSWFFDKLEPRTPDEIPHLELDVIRNLPDAIKTLEML